MKIKSFIAGIVVGSAVTAGVFWVFGDDIRGNVADTTEHLGRGIESAGETVEKAGETIKDSGKKLDD